MKKDKKLNQEQFHPDPRNDLERFILGRIPEITAAYGLGNIRFYVKTEKDKIDKAPENGIFCINYDSTYKAAYILIAPYATDLYECKEYKTLSDALIHEIGHIITDRLGKLAKSRHTTKKDIEDTVEETTESIANIVRMLLSKVNPMKFK